LSGELSDLTMKVVGVVKNEMKEPGMQPNLQDIVSEIELYKDYADGLDGLDQYSHAIIIFQFHLDRHPGPKPMKQHPHNQEKYPQVGIYALRGSDRPNRIGICMAKILGVSGNKLKISGCDALNGSPVIDIKPYIPRSDAKPDATVSSWQLAWQNSR